MDLVHCLAPLSNPANEEVIPTLNTTVTTRSQVLLLTPIYLNSYIHNTYYCLLLMRPSNVLHKLLKTLHNSRTVLNPMGHQLSHSLERLKFSPSSLLLLSTPGLTDYSLEQIRSLTKSHPDLQVIMANTLSGTERPIISELWLSDRIDINSYTIHDGSEEQTTGRQWKFINSTLRISSSEYNFVVPVANGTELRGPNVLSTMFFQDTSSSSSSSSSWRNLNQLEISLPLSLQNMNHHHNFKKLNKETLFITRFDGNVLHTLNEKSAGTTLMDAFSKHKINKVVEVYAKLFKYGTNESFGTHKVIAGGGQWGSGADLLVLDGNPQMDDEGMYVDLFYVDPDMLIKKNVDEYGGEFGVQQVYIDDEKKVSVKYEDDNIVENHFFFGSETGFEMNGISYRSPLETLTFDIVDH